MHLTKIYLWIFFFEYDILGAGTSTQIQLNTTDNGVNMQRMDDPSAQKHNTFSGFTKQKLNLK